MAYRVTNIFRQHSEDDTRQHVCSASLFLPSIVCLLCSCFGRAWDHPQDNIRSLNAVALHKLHTMHLCSSWSSSIAGIQCDSSGIRSEFSRVQFHLLMRSYMTILRLSKFGRVGKKRSYFFCSHLQRIDFRCATIISKACSHVSRIRRCDSRYTRMCVKALV